MKSLVRLIVAGALALVAPLAGASFHLFQINQIYSNADGTVQFIVLREGFGANNEQFLMGHQLQVTHSGNVKTFMFDHDLPSSQTANRFVLIGTVGFAALGIVTPDYTIPNGFLPTDGGSLNYAFVNFVNFASLPIDGNMAITAGGATVQNLATNFAGQSGSVPALPVTAVEFFNAGLDHYFISALQPDIDALDTGRFMGWTRTGESFKVYPTQAVGGPGANPVCRILIPPPGDSHFFSASPQECSDTMAKFPFFTFESPDVFFIALPVTSGPMAGTCPAGTIPVYRVFNNRADPNHRYTISRAIRDQMVGRGGTAEGYGDDAVIMCAPA